MSFRIYLDFSCVYQVSVFTIHKYIRELASYPKVYHRKQYRRDRNVESNCSNTAVLLRWLAVNFALLQAPHTHRSPRLPRKSGSRRKTGKPTAFTSNTWPNTFLFYISLWASTLFSYIRIDGFSFALFIFYILFVYCGGAEGVCDRRHVRIGFCFLYYFGYLLVSRATVALHTQNYRWIKTVMRIKWKYAI